MHENIQSGTIVKVEGSKLLAFGEVLQLFCGWSFEAFRICSCHRVSMMLRDADVGAFDHPFVGWSSGERRCEI